MSRLRTPSRSRSSLTPPDTPATPPQLTLHQPHTYRQLTLVPQMKTIKGQRTSSSSSASQHTPHKPALKLKSTTADSASADSKGSFASQPRKQATLDTFLVPKAQQLTVEQRRQQRRERKQRSNAAANSSGSRQRTTSTVTVDGGENEEEEDARQRRKRREVEARERMRALKEERMDSDEEDIPLIHIAPPVIPSSQPGTHTSSSASSQSQSSMQSSLLSSLSLSLLTPSSLSPVRRLKDEDDDEWDPIPSFVLQPQQPYHLPQSSAQLPPPPDHQPLPAASSFFLPPQPPAPSLPPPLPVPAAASFALNPFAQQTSSASSVKAEWDDAPEIRMPLSQILQKLTEVKAIKQENTASSANKENHPPPSLQSVVNTPPAKPRQAQRSSPPSPSSPPPLEQPTQRELSSPPQRHSSIASERSIDTISSVEEEDRPMRIPVRPERVKRERVLTQPDEIEDDYEPQQQRQNTEPLSRHSFFPPHNGITAVPHFAAPVMQSVGQPAPSSFFPPPAARPLYQPPLYQPQPVHPHSGLSPFLTSPPPVPHYYPHPALPSLQHQQYANPVDSWPPAPHPHLEKEEEKKNPSAAAATGYSFRGISELQGQSSVNYGSLFQPKEKRKRRSKEEKEKDEERAKSEKKKTNKKSSTKGKKRRKTESDAADDEEEEEEEGEERVKKVKKRGSGHWCTVNGQRCYVVGGRRLTGSAAYMAYRKESGDSSSKKKETKKAKNKKDTKKKGSSSKKRSKKEKSDRKSGSDDSGEEEWTPRGDEDGSGSESVDSGDESAGSMADFIVDDSFVEYSSSDERK